MNPGLGYSPDEVMRAVLTYLEAAHGYRKQAEEAVARGDFIKAVASSWAAVLHATAALASAANSRLASLSDVLHREPSESLFAKVGSRNAEKLRDLFTSIRDDYCDAVCNGWIAREHKLVVHWAGEYVKLVEELLSTLSGE